MAILWYSIIHSAPLHRAQSCRCLPSNSEPAHPLGLNSSQPACPEHASPWSAHRLGFFPLPLPTSPLLSHCIEVSIKAPDRRVSALMVAVPLAPAGRHLSNSGQSPGYTCRLYLWSRVSEQIPTRSINGCMLNEGFCMTSSFILGAILC